MKKLLQTLVLLTALLFADIKVSSAQTILSITKTPANPTSNDTITFLADCRFPSGNCDPFTVNLAPGGNNFYVYALHCLGVLSFICSYTDTFKIPPHPAGNYNFIFHLESGFAPSCTPGIVAGPTDTLAFVVSSATGINEAGDLSHFTITPNPGNGIINVHIDQFLENKPSTVLELFNLSGRSIANYSIASTNTQIKIDLPSGIYLYKLNNNPSAIQKLVILK